ncbi:MAG TPA: galactokinase [Candidatus Ligilactobacillus excrementigallinarum]|uniref:Galactokinase n=1 Tax=Candidatus Ligilactobacillus excrementigallinarum TaxID=2838641 RepID=A0A9D1UW39_9LACO|nr:galactokinase [Candidatus Ligilactobacillus excrementigallinarum]
MNKEEIEAKFEEIYQTKPDKAFFSPGRINLIGEHTDYNGGHVFPCAITLGTWGAARKRDDQKLHFYSGNFEDLGIIEVDLNNLKYSKADNWTNYAKGMIFYIQKAGYQVDRGMDIYIWGNLPQGGSGLSSSASIEMLFGVMVEKLFDLQIDRLDLVKMGVKTENEFLGLSSGILDQFAVGMSKKNQAILLDTNTLDYKYVPLDLKDNVIVIMNTNKPRALVESKYNERVEECQVALKALQTKLDIQALGELNNEQFDEYTYLLSDNETYLKRARHAVSENQRCIRGEAALEKGDLKEFGRLQNASHVSLEYDYEVTGKELDTLAHEAWKQPGVLGARMCGAGFGGSGIALVQKDQVEAFKANVGKVYEEKIGYAPRFFTAEVADGTHEL